VPAPQRTARIEDEVWDPAQARAQAEGASLAALMRAAVHAYASGDLTSTAEPASQPAPSLLVRPLLLVTRAPRLLVTRPLLVSLLVRPSPSPARASPAPASSA
jgi:hypothetical protein